MRLRIVVVVGAIMSMALMGTAVPVAALTEFVSAGTRTWLGKVVASAEPRVDKQRKKGDRRGMDAAPISEIRFVEDQTDAQFPVWSQSADEDPTTAFSSYLDKMVTLTGTLVERNGVSGIQALLIQPIESEEELQGLRQLIDPAGASRCSKSLP